MPTEREAVERERKAWDEAAYRLSCCGAGSQESNRLRDNLYPLPKTTRPRVVRDPLGPYEWRCVDGELEYRRPDEADNEWRDGSLLRWSLTPPHIALWADLLANPLEEVGGEG